MTISIEAINRYKISKGIKPNFKNNPKKTIPVINSTVKYCLEILLLQPKHFPPRNRKLKSGTSSYQCKYLPQEKHFDLPVTKDSPVLYLKATTFKKLPIIVPNIKIMNEFMSNILFNFITL